LRSQWRRRLASVSSAFARRQRSGVFALELPVFLALPVAIVLLERWHGVQLPGPLLLVVIVVATYRFGFPLGAVLAVEGVGLLRIFGQPFTMRFGWATFFIWTIFSVGCAFLVDRVVTRENRARRRAEASEERFVWHLRRGAGRHDHHRSRARSGGVREPDHL
jgi:uncharacterized membrane protein YhaH (DUF805 family)